MVQYRSAIPHPQPPPRLQNQPNKKRRLVFILAPLILIVLLLPVIWISRQDDKSSNTENTAKNEPSFDKTQFSLTDPTSPWVVVNKKNPLSPSDYSPTDLRAPNITLKWNKTAENMQLRAEVATALEALNQAATTAGIELVLVSGYRSYDTQTDVYDSMVRGYGQAQADRESARPGHSEHQTGWAVDLGAVNKECELEICFADTPEGKWLAQNAYKFGFVIRYADGKESVTGYQYEPWHLRYVGTVLSEEMHRTNVDTLEEFFDLPNAPNY